VTEKACDRSSTDAYDGLNGIIFSATAIVAVWGHLIWRGLLGAAIMEVVDNQLREGTPPVTRQTLDRLLAAGYPERDARRLIACAVTSEIFDVLKNHQPYDEARYLAALHRLPMLPWE